MWPALFGGAILSVGALVASVTAGVRVAASVCVLASASTAVGIVVTAGISDHQHLVFDAVNVVVAAIPAVVAVSILTRRSRVEHRRRPAAVPQSRQ
jgi:hypothetical protein